MTVVRILGEGVFEIPDADLPAIEQLDAVLVDALEHDDEATFSGALADLVGEVKHSGKRLPDEEVAVSDLVVPHPGSSLAEVKALLAEG